MPLRRSTLGLLSRRAISHSTCGNSAAVSSAVVAAAPPQARKGFSTLTTSPSPETPRQRVELDAALQHVLCSPRAPLPVKHVYHRLTNAHRLIHEFHHSKRSRRLHSQRVALRFLRRHNVLMHGLLFYAPRSGTWNHTAEFSRLALVGEAHLTAEIRARTLRLLPEVSASAYVALTNDAGARDAICALFDELHMAELVDSPLEVSGVVASPQSRRARRGAPVLTAMTKYHMLCATLAEMYWFVARTRGADRVTNNALFPPSDVLILNVLCTHLLETIPAELLLAQLAAPIASVCERWVNKSMSLPSQLHLKPRTLNVHALNKEPHSGSVSDGRCRTLTPQPAAPARPLTVEPEPGRVMSVMHPVLDWTKVTASRTPVPPPRAAQLSLSGDRQTGKTPSEPTDLTDARRHDLYSALS